MTDRLKAAAQALVNRWDGPKWGGSAENLHHTGEYIAALRAALAEQPAEREPITKETYLQELLAFMNTNDPSRWEIGFRNIVSILLGPKSSFEIADVVEMVRQLKQSAEQEPVAWRTFDGEGDYDYRSYDDNEGYADEWTKRNPNHIGWVEPLYTAPQPAIPPGYKLVPLNRSYDMRVQALLAFNSSKGDRDDALQDAWQAMLNAAPEAPQPAMQPLLVRDLAELIGSTVPDVCKALEDLGIKPRRSTNAAVTPDEALEVARQIAQPAKRVPLTPRELELIDGMIEVQLIHAERCDAIANRRIAAKQKEWDMERVELLRKIRAHGITGEAA